MAHVFWNTVY